MKTKTTPQSVLIVLAAILCSVFSLNSSGQTPCDPPSGLNSTGVTASRATLNWTAVAGAAAYNVNYRIAGDPSWTATISTTESLILTSLSPSSNYEWQVQTDCGNSNVSAFSVTETFSTTAYSCSVPTGLNTTGITLSDATMNWTIVPGAVGYNIQYRLVGAPSWTSSSSWSLSDATTASLTVSSLAPGNYEWQVQTDCGNSNVSAYSALSNFITLPPLVCEMTSGLNVTGVTSTAAAMSWVAVNGAQSYNIRYRSSGNSVWTEVNTISSSLSVSSLTPATAYQWQVQTVCMGDGKSYYCKPASFSTLSGTGCDVIPTALNAVSSSATSVFLSWIGRPGASCVIQYRQLGAQAWSTTNSSGTSVTLSGLSSSASYEWMVATNCGNNNRSAFSAIAVFSMSALSQNVNPYISTVPNQNNPSTRSAMFLSTGNAATDAQVVLDWLAAHGIH